MIARTATAQDDITGDGTTSSVLLIGELLKQSERFLAEGIHPRVIIAGLDLAREHALQVLDEMKVERDCLDKELLLSVARTSLRTKVRDELADKLTDIVAESVLTIRREGKPIDLFMVEIMHMQHQADVDTRFVKGRCFLTRQGLRNLRTGSGPWIKAPGYAKESLKCVYISVQRLARI